MIIYAISDSHQHDVHIRVTYDFLCAYKTHNNELYITRGVISLVKK